MKLTELARGQECFLRIMPPCAPNDTVVGCHIQRPGRGTVGGKEHDIFAVPGCARCHEIIDRRGHEWREVPPEMVEKCKRRAMQEWTLRLIEIGVLKLEDAS